MTCHPHLHKYTTLYCKDHNHNCCYSLYYSIRSAFGLRLWPTLWHTRNMIPTIPTTYELLISKRVSRFCKYLTPKFCYLQCSHANVEIFTSKTCQFLSHSCPHAPILDFLTPHQFTFGLKNL